MSAVWPPPRGCYISALAPLPALYVAYSFSRGLLWPAASLFVSVGPLQHLPGLQEGVAALNASMVSSM